MKIAIELPEDVAQRLEANGSDLTRRALEALAVDAYRTGEITEAEVQRLLGLSSRWEVDAFLKQAQAYLDYTEADLERDILAIRKVSPG
jgi:esterase/lipase superfamily enzyme